VAGELTPEEQHELIREYGSIPNAVHEACMGSDEVSELWQTRLQWPSQRDFDVVFWKLARPVLGLADVPSATVDIEKSAHVAPNDKARGAVIPFDLVEEAVRKKEHEGLGKRPLGQLPGMGEWWATEILRWHKVGRPAGLWLDDHDQLQWGAAITPVGGGEQREHAIAPTPRALRLPRI
jgi:hypothetical protein